MYAQNKEISKTTEALSEIDSLKIVLKNAKHDTTRCNILSAMVEAESDVKVWSVYNEQLKTIAEKALLLQSGNELNNKYLKYLSSALNNTGYMYDVKANIPKALEYYGKSLKIQKQINDKTGIATSLNNIGMVYDHQGEVAKALEYYNKSLIMYKETRNRQGVAISSGNIALIYMKQGDIPNALQTYHQSLKVFEQINNTFGIATCFNNIANIYHNQKDFDNALQYYNKSLNICEKTNDKNGIARAINSMGGIYHLRNNIPMAMEYYQKSLKIQEEIKNKRGIANSFNNLGSLYRTLAEQAIKEKRPAVVPDSLFNKAFKYFTESLKIKKEINDKPGITYSYNSISSILFEQGKTEQALPYSLQSLSLAGELGFPENIKNASELLFRIYKKQNKPAEALRMHELYIQMRDSISNAETRKAITKQQFKYEYEKKELVLKTEQEKKDIIHADQSKNQKIVIGSVASGLLLVILFSFFLYNRFKITQKQKKIIEAQKVKVDEAYTELHEKNKEVIDSITYALRIQRALLPREKYIDKHLNRLTQN